MNSMTRDDVVAELALRDLEKRERLREIVHQPGFHYYTRGSWHGVISTLVSCAAFAWWVLRDDIPDWGVFLLVISVVGLLEATRQRDRLNALLELSALEKQEANKPEHLTPDPPKCHPL